MTRRTARRDGVSLTAAIPVVYRSLGRARALVWVLGALALVGGLVDAASLYLVARLATSLADPAAGVQITIGSLVDVHLTIGETLTWSAVAVAVLMALSVPIAAVSARLSAIALTNCRETLLSAYLASSWSFRSDQPEGHLQHLVAEFTPRVERFVMQLTAIIVNSAGILMSIVAAVIAAPQASVYFVVGLGLVAVCYVPLNKAMSRLSAAYLRSNRELASEIAQTSRLAQEIESFHVGRPLADRLGADVEASSEVLRRFRLQMVVIPASYQNAALAVVLAVIAVLRAGGSAQLAVLGPVLLLLVRALIYARQLQYALQTAIEMTPYATGLDAELAELRDHPAVDGSRTLAAVGDVRFVDLGFAHVPGQPVLDGLDLDVPFGTVLGIAGPSGVGKSTLAQLLLRLRQPTAGRIDVGGVDLRAVDAASWAALVAFVPQDNKLLRGTIAENIAFLRPFDAEAVRAAAQRANLLDEVLALPDGFDTEVGPGARDLSGGQKQRLGIARALVGAPQLIVLDEPTSALDTASEALVGRTIDALRGTATVVIVTHRPETLGFCDRVLELRRPDRGDEIAAVDVAAVSPR